MVGFLYDVVGFGKGSVHVAPVGVQHGAVVAAKSESVAFEVFQVGVNGGRASGKRRHRVDNGIKVFVFDLDERKRFHGSYLVIGGNGGHRLADEEHLVAGHDPAVAQCAGAEVDVGEVAAGDDATNAGQGLGLRSVDADDTGVAAGAGQHLAHQHFGQVDIAGVGGVAGHLVKGVYADVAFAENIELCHLSTPLPSRFQPRPSPLR